MKKFATKLKKEVASVAEPTPETCARWLTRSQLAKRYQVSLRSVDYWAEARRIPVYRVGRVLRFDPSECDLALQSFRIPAAYQTQGTS